MALVPIYQYRNGMGFLRYFFTTQGKMDGTSFNSVPTDDLTNWTNNQTDGIAFYGCAATDPGAVPIYQYQAPVGVSGQPAAAQKYFFSPLNQAFGPSSGWTQSSSNPAFYVYGAPDCGLAEVTMWYIEQPQFSYFWGCNPQSAMIGNFVAQSDWLPVGWSIAPGQTDQPFYAMPGSAQLAYSITAFNASQVPDPETTPSVIATQYITNSSQYATIAQDISYSLALTNTFTVSLQETLSYSAAQKVSVNVLFMSAEETITIGVQLSSTQTWTTTTTQTVEISSTVTVPPTYTVTVQGTVNVVTDVPIPFTMTVGISAESNGVALSGAPVNCQALTDLFWQQNPQWPANALPQLWNGGGGGIIVTLSGTLTCTFALTTELEVSDVVPTGGTGEVELGKGKSAKAAIAGKTAQA
jgi:hypothetical protein